MLKRLILSNLRSFDDADIALTSGLNLIVGDNGSGKTTVLEAIYLLFRGRSFRHREISPLIKDGQTQYQLFTEFLGKGRENHRLGLQQDKQNILIKLDGETAKRRSDIIHLLPIEWIGPDPQALITDEPEGRRAFIDNGLFHVEHDYLSIVQKYHRALDQRNASLKQNQNATTWDQQLVEYGSEIQQRRYLYLKRLITYIEDQLKDWNLDIEVKFSYQRGWSDELSLLDALKKNLETDRKRKFTSVGPHRADLVIKAGDKRSSRKLSRGQLKMLVAAMHLAQTRYRIDSGFSAGILLIDDLPAELDETNKNRLISAGKDLYPQMIIVSLTEAEIPELNQSVNTIHVSRGTVIKSY
jgi:DNA replication and repair protein RecF